MWWAGACGVIHGVIPSVACMRRGSGYCVFLWGKNSSKKFEIKIVGKKEHRWGEWSDSRGSGGLERVV